MELWSGGLDCLCKVERGGCRIGRESLRGPHGSEDISAGPEQGLPSEKFRVGTGWPGLSTLRCSLISWGLSSGSMASALKPEPSGRCCGWRLAVSSPHPWQLPSKRFPEGGTEWHRSTSVSDGQGGAFCRACRARSPFCLPQVTNPVRSLLLLEAIASVAISHRPWNRALGSAASVAALCPPNLCSVQVVSVYVSVSGSGLDSKHLSLSHV